MYCSRIVLVNISRTIDTCTQDAHMQFDEKHPVFSIASDRHR